jgi:uncharacterized membrane protein
VDITWICAMATIAMLASYEAGIAIAQRRSPHRLARSAHAALRQEWFTAVSQQQDSDILAVQTLRNALMSATMIASTAVLGLVGTVTLAAPSLNATFGEAALAGPHFTARLALELVLMTLLFASLLSSAMAVRYYNHAGFICGMPVGCEARQRWSGAGQAYVRRAGTMYSWGLRHLILVAPILASILHPLAGPVAAALLVAALIAIDRVGAVAP